MARPHPAVQQNACHLDLLMPQSVRYQGIEIHGIFLRTRGTELSARNPDTVRALVVSFSVEYAQALPAGHRLFQSLLSHFGPGLIEAGPPCGSPRRHCWTRHRRADKESENWSPAKNRARSAQEQSASPTFAVRWFFGLGSFFLFCFLKRSPPQAWDFGFRVVAVRVG